MYAFICKTCHLYSEAQGLLLWWTLLYSSLHMIVIKLLVYLQVVKSAEQTNSKYPQLHKDIDCTNIMLRMAYRDYEVIDPPPRTPPSDLLDQFTMYGAVPMEEYYINDIGNQHYSHSEEYLEALIKKVPSLLILLLNRIDDI